MLNLRHTFNDGVLHHKDSFGLRYGDVRQGYRHIEQRTFIKWRHKLRTEIHEQRHCNGESQQVKGNSGFLPFQHPADNGGIEFNEKGRNRI